MGWRMSISGTCALIRSGEGAIQGACFSREAQGRIPGSRVTDQSPGQSHNAHKGVRHPHVQFGQGYLGKTLGETGLEKGTGRFRVSKYLRIDTVGALASNRFPMAFGWDGVRLNGSSSGSGCDPCVESTSSATVGVTAPGEERIILCVVCKESL